jgi:diacylglycerol kinase family enzyme
VNALKIALVYNPFSGGYRESVLSALETALRSAGHCVTRYDSLQISKSNSLPDAEAYCISGGDGTARLALSNPALQLSGVPICIHPTGTINLIARELAYPSEPKAMAARLQRHGPTQSVHLGTINDAAFLACVTVGPDSLAVAGVSTDLKRKIGRFAYVVSLFKILWHWPRPALTVTVDGADHAAEAVFVAKARFYAGSWTIDHAATFTSNKFRILIMPRARRRDYVRFGVYCLTGSRNPSPDWMLLDGQRVNISGPANVPVQADGDIVASLPVCLTVDPVPMEFL